MATLLKTWGTYFMQSGSSSPSNPDMQGQIRVYLESQSTSGNYSNIRIDHYYKTYHSAPAMTSSFSYGTVVSNYRANNGSFGGTYKNSTDHDGIVSVLFYNGGYSNFYLIGSTTERIYHNADGSAQLYVNGSISAKLKINGTVVSDSTTSSFNTPLPTIPRATTITSFTWAKASGAAGISRLTCNWATAHSIDRIQYSLNGGSYTTVTGSGTSGSFNISSLTPNTAYSLKIKVRRTDSQVETESSVKSATTYDYAKITGADSINDTGPPYMTFTNPSGAVIDAYIEYGFVNGTATANIQIRANISNTGNYTFTLTQGELDAIYAKMPNDPSQTIRYVIVTKVDGTAAYWSVLDRTFTVVNANPTFTTWTYADTNATTIALTGSNQKIVKGYSNVKATITSANKMVAIKGATATSYQLTIGAKNATANYSPSSTVEMTINAVDNSVMTCYAKDSRENSTPKAITASTYINYSPISISAATGKRTDDIGTQTTLAYNGTFFGGSFGSVTNTIKSATYKFKKTTDVDYTDGTSVITPTPSGNTFSFSGTIKGDAGTGGVNGFNATYSYNIQVIVTDELSTHTFNFILGTGTPNIAISQNGVAINQAYDETLGGALQVNGPAYINGSYVLKENDIVDNLASTSTTDPLSANQGKVLQDNKANLKATSNYSTPTLAFSALATQTGLNLTYAAIAAENINTNISTWINTNQNVETGGPNYQGFIAGTTTLYTAIITNYTSSYIILFRRVSGDYYASIMY